MLQREHSAILSTFIKLIKICVLSIFEWPFYTGFTKQANWIMKFHELAVIENCSDTWMCESTFILVMTCDFQKCGILTSVDSDEPVQPPFKLLRNSNRCSVSSLTVIEYSVTSKGSDQTVCMCRLIWGIAGSTNHNVGNLMLWLIY